MFKKSSGKISTILLVLAFVLVILIIAVFAVTKITSLNTSKNSSKSGNGAENIVEPPKPVYDTTLENVRFIFESAQDLGNVVYSKDVRYQPNLTTTEKFIKVAVRVQNKGKFNFPTGSWNTGNIVDSEGRNFIPVDDQWGYFFPKTNSCGSYLKPEFEPVPCTKLYEVSKASNQLKLMVGANNKWSFLDLMVTQ